MWADTLHSVPAGGEAEFDLERTRLNIERAPDTIQALTDLGVVFTGVYPEPPHAIPRMHCMSPSPTAAIERLRIALDEKNVDIRTLTELVDIGPASGSSRTVTVKDRRTGDQQTVTATRGVVLSGGVFRPTDPFAAIARRAGAAISGAHRTKEVVVDGRPIGQDVFRTLYPPYLGLDGAIWKAGGVLVNRHGQRYTNEVDANRAVDTALQTEAMGWFVFDAKLVARVATEADDSRPGARDGWLKPGKLTFGTFPGLGWGYFDDLRRLTRHVVESDTLQGLARQMYVPEETFRQTIEEYNARISAGDPDPFGRPQGVAVDEGPYYAIGPIGTFAGSPLVQAAALTTTPDLRVLDDSGKPLVGLYAAGGMAESDVFLGGHGGRLAHAFSTGRIAGQTAAQAENKDVNEIVDNTGEGALA
jgi:hypothetical protein